MKYASTRFITVLGIVCLRITVYLLIAIWCCTALDAFAMEFDDIVITPELTPSGNSHHGYVEYRIAVANLSPKKTHKVKLILPKDSFGYSGNRIREMTRSVVVGPSATAHVSLFQPPVGMYGNALGVVIDGRVQDDTVPLAIGRHGGQRRGTHVSMSSSRGRRRFTSFAPSFRILMSRNVDAKDLHDHADKLFGVSAASRRGPPTYETINLGLPVSAWSTNWLGFSRYDSVVVTGDDIRQMPPDVRSALRRYVECGGALLVLGGLELPESWELRESQRSEPLTDAVGLVNYNIGFGQCMVSTERDTKGLKPEQWREIVDSWVKTAAPWQVVRSVEDANNVFPVTEGLGIPVRGLFLLMLLFAVVIGPVNLIVLSRQKRRIWMLWTVPVISLLTCLAVFAYATFAEGWNRHGRTEGLTLLDERIHRATTIGWTAFYASLTPGDGLHFGYATELTPQGVDMGTVRTIDWTRDQHLKSGWMTARVPAYFLIRKSEVRRERITVRREANSRLKVVNGLGTDIRKFWLADRDGTIHTATGIRAGAEAELVPREELRLAKADVVSFDETLLVELWDPHITRQLDTGNISPVLRDEIRWVGALLSDDVVISVQKRGQQWEITDQILGRTYTVKKATGASTNPLRVYRAGVSSLRGIFASTDWIKSIERLTTNPEQYLRPGCYIASLDAAPFIEEGLRKVREKKYSSIVYGILDEE